MAKVNTSPPLRPVRPFKTFKEGNVELALFKNTMVKESDGIYYSFWFGRTYFDDQAEIWRNTNNFRTDDLPALANLFNQCWEFISQNPPTANIEEVP